MKNLTLFLFVLLFGSLQAQNFQKSIDNKIVKIAQKLQGLEIKSGDYKFCEVSKDYDEEIDKLVISENISINIKTNGNNLYVEFDSYKYDEGDTIHSIFKSYNSHRFAGEDIGYAFYHPDSSFIFQEDSTGTFLNYLKTVTKYEGNLPIEERTFVDSGILFGGNPIGLVLSNIKTFHYNGGRLTATTEIKMNLNTGQLGISDSTAFSYDGNNLIEEVKFRYISDSLLYHTVSKIKYSYDNNDNPILEEDWVYFGQWFISERSNLTFDNKHREIFALNEKTYDKGETWMKNDRDSTIYDAPTLYLGIPNREVTEDWLADDTWRIGNITTYEDCGSVPDNTIELNKLNFDARFNNETIVIDANDNTPNDIVLLLVDLQGRTLFEKEYKNIPNTIQTSGLPDGMYILSIRSKNGQGVKKLIKK